MCLLAGLPPRYKPMIITLESSGVDVTMSEVEQCGYYAQSNFQSREVRCYNCNRMGHFSRQCCALKWTEVKACTANATDKADSENDDIVCALSTTTLTARSLTSPDLSPVSVYVLPHLRSADDVAENDALLVVSMTSGNASTEWVLDSDASRHMCHSSTHMRKRTQSTVPRITAANKALVPVQAVAAEGTARTQPNIQSCFCQHDCEGRQ